MGLAKSDSFAGNVTKQCGQTQNGQRTTKKNKAKKNRWFLGRRQKIYGSSACMCVVMLSSLTTIGTTEDGEMWCSPGEVSPTNRRVFLNVAVARNSSPVELFQPDFFSPNAPRDHAPLFFLSLRMRFASSAPGSKRSEVWNVRDRSSETQIVTE